jgi:hypothetical protein
MAEKPGVGKNLTVVFAVYVIVEAPAGQDCPSFGFKSEPQAVISIESGRV